jgi:nucleoside-diphosphate-sugar epimerase
VVKKKILITGGSGYIGSRLSLYLSQKGFDIIPLCNSKIPDNREWVQSKHLVLQGDLRDKATLNKIEAVRPDAIIHLVSLDHNQSGINIEETLQVNVQSTWELLSLSASIGLEKFIYFSTTQIYGQTSENVVIENTKSQPINAYGLTHKMSEDLVDFYRRSKNLDAVSLRLSNSYGEPVFHDANCWSLVVNDLCRSAFLHKKIVLNSDGLATRDLIHYSSICSTVEQLLNTEIISKNNAINLSAGESISLLSLALVVKKVYQKNFNNPIDIFINKTELLLNNKVEHTDNKLILSNQVLNMLIKFEDFELEMGIQKLFDYFVKKSFKKNI